MSLCVFSFLVGLLLGRNHSLLLSLPSDAHVDDGYDKVPESTLPSFTDLLIKSGSDKYHNHHYEHYYETWLGPFRHKPQLRMLEIGVDSGVSLALWKNYFTRAELLVGLAYYDHPVIQYVHKDTGEHIRYKEHPYNNNADVSRRISETVKVIGGDQSKMETMDLVCADGPFDVIMDDGSHVPFHVMFSLFSLFGPCLKEGGMYIIEDVETSYWGDGDGVYGYRLEGTGFGAAPDRSVTEKLKQFIDLLVREKTDIPKDLLSIMPGDVDLCEMRFGKNVVALYKCTKEQSTDPPVYKYFGQNFDKTRALQWLESAMASNPNGTFPAQPSRAQIQQERI